MFIHLVLLLLMDIFIFTNRIWKTTVHYPVCLSVCKNEVRAGEVEGGASISYDDSSLPLLPGHILPGAAGSQATVRTGGFR